MLFFASAGSALAQSCPFVAPAPHFVFFKDRPGKLANALVAIKVQVPVNARIAPEDSWTILDIGVVESADSVKAGDRLQVRIEPPEYRNCSMTELGSLGRQAYMFRRYERAKDDGLYFHAFWLPGVPTFKPARRWTTYIVDPAVRAKAEAGR